MSAPKRCREPRATPRVVAAPGGPLAWCAGCHAWKPARQVPQGQERRNTAGRITATYAPKPH